MPTAAKLLSYEEWLELPEIEEGRERHFDEQTAIVLSSDFGCIGYSVTEIPHDCGTHVVTSPARIPSVIVDFRSVWP